MMSSNIRELSESDNSALFEQLRKGITQFASFTSKIVSGPIGYGYYTDIFEWANSQLSVIDDATELTLSGRYRSALICIRSIFENYFNLRLVAESNRYAQRIEKNKEDRNLETAVKRIENEIVEERKRGRKDIIGIDKIRNLYYLVIKGPYVNNIEKRENLVSRYYTIFRNHKADVAFLPRELMRNQWYISEDVNDSLRKRLDENIKYQKGIHKNILTFDKILDHCELNEFLNSEQRERVRVHYSYLSLFVHPTVRSVEVLRTDNTINPYINQVSDLYHYDFFVCHLCLLYLTFLSLMYLELLHRIVKNASQKYFKGISSQEEFKTLKKTIISNFGYFWFIYHGGPADIDKFIQLTKSRLTKKKDFRKLPDYRVTYYIDPLRHLWELSGSWNNKLLGSVAGPLANYSHKLNRFF